MHNMNKKIISAALAVLLTFGMGVGTCENNFIADNSAISASAETEYTSGDFKYTKGYRNNVTITAYTGKSPDVVIPEKIDGYDVTFLDRWMFSDSATNIVTVSLPSTLESYGDNLFLRCTNLERIDVDPANTHLGSKDGMLYKKYDKKFLLCPPKSKVENVVLPECITEIAGQAFNRCENIKSIEIPNGTTTIRSFAIYVCPSLKNITIPQSVETVENSAFFQCENLEKFTVSSANNKLSSENGILFNKAKTTLISCPPKNPVKKVYIPASVTTVMSNAFEKCINITDVYFKGQNTSIEDYTFRGCENIENVELSNTIKTVGVEAFSGCKKLKNVKFSNVLESVGNFAFMGCENLSSVTLPETLTSIGFLAFGFGDNGQISNFRIIGKPGSEAENYATKYNFTFVDVSSLPVAKNISNCEITLDKTQATFSGSEIKPNVTVKDGSATLKNGTDYTVSYANNTKVGTATVTVTGIGNYEGKVDKTFTITAKAIKNCEITLDKTQATFNGGEIKPNVTVKDGSATLKNGTDYTVSYANNAKAGTATVTIKGTGNYEGTVNKTFRIVSKSLKYCDVSLSAEQMTFNGQELKPKVTVKISGKTIYSGNYTVTYANNAKVGTATVTITGKGSLTGTVTKTFKIVSKSIKYCDVSLSGTSFSYTGKAIQPKVTVKINDKALYSGNYSVIYKNNINKGTATVVITGKNNLTGSVTKTFTIK